MNIQRESARNFLENNVNNTIRNVERIKKSENSTRNASVAEVQKKRMAFSSKYLEFREVQLKDSKDYYLNLNKVLYDEEINLITNENSIEVSEEGWAAMLQTKANFTLEINKLWRESVKMWIKLFIYECIKHIFNVDKVNECLVRQKEINNAISSLSIKQNQWSNFSIWVGKVLESKDGRNCPELIKDRIFSLYQKIIASSEKDQNRLLDLISDHSTNCPDRAVVGLERAEIQVQLIGVSEDLKINMLILEFKRHIIQTELVSNDSAESVEIYLFYSLYFNEILMLKNKNKLMMHTGIGNKYSFEDAVSGILKRMTVEDLVGFIANHEIFQSTYHQQEKSMQAKIKELMDDSYVIDDMTPLAKAKFITDVQATGVILAENDIQDILNSPSSKLSVRIMQFLDNRRVRFNEGYYEEKAKELLLNKGFLTKDVNYKDPNSFPETKLLTPEEFDYALVISSGSVLVELLEYHFGIYCIAFAIVPIIFAFLLLPIYFAPWVIAGYMKVLLKMPTNWIIDDTQEELINLAENIPTMNNQEGEI